MLLQVGVSVRNTDTNAPRILWNMGLTLLEGQCRPINKEVLKIMDRDNLQQVSCENNFVELFIALVICLFKQLQNRVSFTCPAPRPMHT